MDLKTKLKKAIFRSERAYTYYLNNKKYFQAIRIYKSNKIIYQLLEEFLYKSYDLKHDSMICDYIFHLDDWFQQFEREASSNNPLLEDTFVFNRLEGSLPFPKEIKEIIL